MYRNYVIRNKETGLFAYGKSPNWRIGFTNDLQRAAIFKNVACAKGSNHWRKDKDNLEVLEVFLSLG